MSTMQELAQAIATNVDALRKALQTNKAVEPTLENQQAEFPTLDAEGDLTRANLLSALYQLERLVLGPFQNLFDFTTACFDIGALRTLVRFNVPRLVPLDGSISYAKLSKSVGMREDILRHYVREVIVTFDFLAEDSLGNVSHSPASRMWHTHPDMADTIEWNLDYKAPAAVAEADARVQDPQGVRDEICGYTQSFKAPQGEYEPMYKHMARSPEQSRKFQAMMRAASTRGGSESILHLYNWAEMKGKVLVDVGGSTGHISALIAEHHPEIKIIVQDLPNVIQRATAPDAPAMPPSVSFQEYNFFTPQPVIADAYLFRSCFHNWSDAAMKKIVENQVLALHPGAKLFLVERIMPAPGSGNIYQEKQARQLDMNMAVLMNGRCRDVEELRSIIEGVEPRLKFKGIKWARITTISDPRSHSLLEWVFE